MSKSSSMTSQDSGIRSTKRRPTFKVSRQVSFAISDVRETTRSRPSFTSGRKVSVTQVSIAISDVRETTRSRPSVTSGRTVSVTQASRSEPKKMKSILKANRAAERYFRTKYALGRIGGAVLGSAFTTLGSAVFLLLCQMYVFFKIGAVIVGVTAFAVIFAMVPLPALLMVAGPRGHDFKGVWEILMRIAAGALLEEHRLKEDDEAFDEDARGAAVPVNMVVAPVAGDRAHAAASVAVGAAAGSEDEVANAFRRYVHHMPAKGMGQCEPDEDSTSLAAPRTWVTCTG